MQLDRRLERNEAFGDADRIIACEMRRVEVHLDKGERLEPENAAVVRVNVAAKVIRPHVIHQNRIIESLHRAHGALRVVTHVEFEVRETEGANLRRKGPIRPLADLAHTKTMGRFHVPRGVPVLPEGVLTHGGSEEEVRGELIEDPSVLVIDAEIRVVRVLLQQLDIVVRRSNRVGHNRIPREGALAEWADVFVIARRHSHEAAKAR
jgi:hypothetical protein